MNGIFMELCLASISPRVFSFSTIFFFFLQCSTLISSPPQMQVELSWLIDEELS